MTKLNLARQSDFRLTLINSFTLCLLSVSLASAKEDKNSKILVAST